MTEHTPGPWQYVPSTEHHGPYVTSDHGSYICDCYTMTEPSEASVRNGGPSKPVLFLGEMADPNARLITEAPEMATLLQRLVEQVSEPANAEHNLAAFAQGSIVAEAKAILARIRGA